MTGGLHLPWMTRHWLVNSPQASCSLSAQHSQLFTVATDVRDAMRPQMTWPSWRPATGCCQPRIADSWLTSIVRLADRLRHSGKLTPLWMQLRCWLPWTKRQTLSDLEAAGTPMRRPRPPVSLPATLSTAGSPRLGSTPNLLASWFCNAHSWNPCGKCSRRSSSWQGLSGQHVLAVKGMAVQVGHRSRRHFGTEADRASRDFFHEVSK